MSSFTKCNYCQLKAARALAAQTDQKITIMPTPHKLMGGMDILMHRPDEPPDPDKHWIMWFMGLSNKCCCGD